MLAFFRIGSIVGWFIGQENSNRETEPTANLNAYSSALIPLSAELIRLKAIRQQNCHRETEPTANLNTHSSALIPLSVKLGGSTNRHAA